ncbi:MAG: hypothetical protein NTX30_16250 [Deltaproteobacteria bacterium]|jgi:hypothetical protein|nr:hypothetical protein [Deltaproteobacteria bacterium]
MKSAQIKNIIPWPEDAKEREKEKPLAPPRIEAMEAVDPEKAGRCMNLPPLSLLLMHSMDREKIEEIKKEESVPVLVVFPARGDEELLTLEREIQILQPLLGRIIDEVWIAFGGSEHDDIPLMAKKYGAQVFYAHRNGMNDARRHESGKGLSMRGLLYHLVADRGLNHPRAIIQFIDADMKEGYFNPRWVIDPVGAVLWFKKIEVAKIVYHRPWGGRLNAFITPFISVFDHPALNPLKSLLYFLSGEIAGTLKFWLSVPFKQNFGIEMKILTSLALNKVNLRPNSSDLNHVIQVFLGEMDHKHSPLRSTGRVKGLDATAKEVFQSFLEDLSAEGLIRMENGLSFSERLQISTVTPAAEGGEEMGTPSKLNLPSNEKTFLPLKNLPAIQAVCPWLKTG